MAQTPTTSDYKPGRTLILFTLAVALLYVLMAVTSSWTPRLGLDLRGGTTITLTARSADGATPPKENVETARSIIQNRVDSLGVGEASVTVQGEDQIEVAVPNINSDELVKLVGTTARLSFRPVLAVQAAQPKPAANQGTGSEEGKPEPGTQPSSEPTTKASVAGEPSAAASTAERGPAPMLPTDPPPSFTPRPTAAGSEHQSIEQKMNYKPTQQDAEDFMAFKCGDEFPDVADQPLIACDTEKQTKYLLGPVIITGQRVVDAKAGIPQGRINWIVSLEFDSEGASQFSEATGLLAGKQSPQNQFAIVLDHEVVSAPQVHEKIPGGHAEISGGSIDEKGAHALATTLRYGALPIDLETSSVDTVSPTLGGNQMSAGIIAGIIGLALVVVYSLLYYRGLTIVVVGSLVAAAVVTYSIIVLLGSAVGFALNLPGIAGAIVAVGITADSFIVYFERIRDEIRDGHRLRHAIESGWRKARNTIIMADGVQLLAALVLYFLAIGAVKGFAFTLGVTTAIDLLLVVFFTHPLMSVLGRTKFFGEGHKFSGFDPEHLGVSRAKLLGRRKAASIAKQAQASNEEAKKND